MRHPRRLHTSAARMQWTLANIAEPLRAAKENAGARRAAGADIPAGIRLVEFRYEWPAGVNVYNVYTDNLSEFNVYTAAVGSPRDLTLAAMADSAVLEVQS